jgi:hypothetical protein
MTLHEIWRRITKSRSERSLEASARMECVLKEEIARLRAENRALLNSILGIAGVPPLPVLAAPQIPNPRSFDAPASGGAVALAIRTDAAGAASAAASADRADPTSTPTPKVAANAAIPMRRRSWHQINRRLEFESAKKKDSIDPA